MQTAVETLKMAARLAGGCAVLSLLLTLAGPTPGAPRTAHAGGSPEVTGAIWQWQGTTTAGELLIPDDPSLYTITFLPNGTVAVRADCNRVTGSYELTGNALTLLSGPTAATQAACPPGSLDRAFLRQLSQAATVRRVGTRLFIRLGEDAATMIFIAAPTDSAAVNEPPAR
jgi:heat shock protein HslJ